MQMKIKHLREWVVGESRGTLLSLRHLPCCHFVHFVVCITPALLGGTDTPYAPVIIRILSKGRWRSSCIEGGLCGQSDAPGSNVSLAWLS